MTAALLILGALPFAVCLGPPCISHERKWKKDKADRYFPESDRSFRPSTDRHSDTGPPCLLAQWHWDLDTAFLPAGAEPRFLFDKLEPWRFPRLCRWLYSHGRRYICRL